MGKVTIIVEADGTNTYNLVKLMENVIPDEDWLASQVYDNLQIETKVRVYIVPSDEED